MAKLNCVSKKTLRVYHEAGLLKPCRVDEETGYRYWDLSQCAVIDMIQQLQLLGVPLADMKSFAVDEPDSIEERLAECSDVLDERMTELLLAKHNVDQLLNNYRFSKRNPLYDTIILEHIPKRHLLHFDVFNENARFIGDDVEKVLEEWELNLRLTKRHMIEHGIPLAIFHNVGCSVSLENLQERRLEISSSFIEVGNEVLADRYHAEERPAGIYLTLYKKSYTETAKTSKRNAEREGLIALLDYAEEHNMAPIGDYCGVIIGETPVFGYRGREMLLKLEIPIAYDDYITPDAGKR